MEAFSSARVLLVHDWLTGMRGGEKCLDVLCRFWPDAPLYTLLHKPGSVAPSIENRPLHPSVLNRLPRVSRYYRYTLPLMPFAAGWKLPACDLVVSMSHAVAKSAQPPEGVPHVCYCFTPMRYAWHMRESYFRSGLKAWAIDKLLAAIRRWDKRTADRVTHYVAISRTIQQRIADCYGRDSTVIYPPVDTDFYTPANEPRQDYYLVVSAFAPYKRIDLAIEACAKLKRKLVIIGTGQDTARLKALAGPDVQFLGWQSDTAIRDHLRQCRALLFPGEEDFGIVPVEANACGTPVIALARGGATETIVPRGRAQGPTGVWFDEQNAESLIGAMEEFEANRDEFQPGTIRRQALRFNKGRFERELIGYLESVVRPTEVKRVAA